MTKVLYTGSFDPITYGHLDIIDRASKLFDYVVVAIMKNPNKVNMFTEEERKQLILECIKEYNNVDIVTSDLSAVDTAEKYECDAIVRGLRNSSDFDYEKVNAVINEEISKNSLNTIFLISDVTYECISSSIVKEVFNLGKDISLYVPSEVVYAMKKKRGK